ncbi:MAG: hypothetical protein PHO37_06940 [Kiritimatiellae bacterium]|nr:hypothetical protein [Kiritimatiellia bacterium]
MNGLPGATIVYTRTLTTAPTTIAENRTLAYYTNASGVLGGASINGGEAEATPYFFTNDGTTATVQFQVYNGVNSVVGGMDNSITVLAGGNLILVEAFYAGYGRPICIDGGVLHSTSGSAAHSDNYINKLTLMNGAQVTGNPIQVGHVSPATLTVSGTSPSTIHSGICCVNTGETLTLNVADVTGDDNPDLSIPGVISDWATIFLNLPIIKSGAGTVSFSHSGNTHKGLFTIKTGCIALAADNTMNPDNPFVLDGGALDMGAAANTVGTLTVNGSGGTLALGPGKLFFANSSAITWSGALTLAGTLVEWSVRFGTDSSGLTAEQLSAIEYNGGKNVRLNSSGYLTAKPVGSRFMLR